MTLIQAGTTAGGFLLLCAALAKLHEYPRLASLFWGVAAFVGLSAAIAAL